MDTNKLKKDAAELGLCDKWSQRWEDDIDKSKLMKIAMSLDGMIFMGENEYPSVGYLLRNVKDICEYHNMFIKKVMPITLDMNSIKSHLIKCRCDVIVPDNYVGFLYVSYQSKIDLEIGSNCDVRITCFNTSKINIIKNNSGTPKIEYKQVKENKNGLQV